MLRVTAQVLETLRRRLHEAAEPSGEEGLTAKIVTDFLRGHPPNKLVTEVGGHGVAAVYGEGGKNGPTVLFRADLDALPIPEEVANEDGSCELRATSHRCGHDGHMTILCGLAAKLHEKPPAEGRAILLFQPAEETGEGAALVLEDERFSDLSDPDMVFALHNLPGYPLGQLVLKEGTFAAASEGLSVELAGTTAHASQPDTGKSPALAVAQMIGSFSAARQFETSLTDASLSTVIHARVGEPSAFGTSPGVGLVQVTLRAFDDKVMERLRASSIRIAKNTALAHDLRDKISWTQRFPATNNDPAATAVVEQAAKDLGLSLLRPQEPFPWSEDFGHFTGRFPGALFGLGIGENHPDLHNPDYEFDDALTPTGVDLFEGIARQLLGGRNA